MGKTKLVIGLGVTAAATTAVLIAAGTTGAAATAQPSTAKAHSAVPVVRSNSNQSTVAEQIAEKFVDSQFHVTASPVRVRPSGSNGWYEVFLKSSGDDYVALVDTTTGRHGGVKVLSPNEFQVALDSAS